MTFFTYVINTFPFREHRIIQDMNIVVISSGFNYIGKKGARPMPNFQDTTFIIDLNEAEVRRTEVEAEYYSDQSKCRVLRDEIKMWLLDPPARKTDGFLYGANAITERCQPKSQWIIS